MKKIDGTSIYASGDDQYEDDITKIIAKLNASPVGHAIIAKIRRHGSLVVTPYTKGDFNAETMADPGYNLFQGKVAYVHFSPSTFETFTVIAGVRIPNVRAIILPGQQPDTTLLHEMVHASRVLGGEFKMTALKGAMATYENEEDFFAITVANVYLSEQGKTYTGMRGSHLLYGPSLQAKEIVSEFFLFENDNFHLIAKYCEQDSKTADMIAKSKAAFNPIRVYVILPSGPPKIDIKSEEPIYVRYQVTQHETMPALSDDYLISILKPRYRADDVKGFGGRVETLRKAFSTVDRYQALKLFARLAARPRGDQVAIYFHDHLSTATRVKMLQLLVTRISA